MADDALEEERQHRLLGDVARKVADGAVVAVADGLVQKRDVGLNLDSVGEEAAAPALGVARDERDAVEELPARGAHAAHVMAAFAADLDRAAAGERDGQHRGQHHRQDGQPVLPQCNPLHVERREVS